MKILALDPGYDRCGIALLERDPSGNETLHRSHCITTDKRDAFERRLYAVISEIDQWIDTYAPDLCALETLFFTTNRKTAMRVAEVRGAILYTACSRGLAVREYGPGEIKVAITGDGRASKQQMMLMVPQLVALSHEVRFDDEYDAIAIALTASALSRAASR